MQWAIAAPFFTGLDDRWLDDFVPPSRHTFLKVPNLSHSKQANWHTRVSRRTPLAAWAGHWDQAGRAWTSEADGYVTVFPQLALMLALKEKIARKDRPLIAWCFNVGARPPEVLRALGSRCLSAVDHFVVHSRGEIDVISSWFDIEPSRISYVPLQTAEIPFYAQEETSAPFLLAMGSAHRDYDTLFRAVAPLKLKTIVVAAAHALAGIRIPDNVEVRQGLSAAECHRLSQQARLNIIPLQPNPTAVGQVTIVEAMRMGRALIATEGVGSRDYVESGKTGLLVPPGDADALRSAIDHLWREDSVRLGLGQSALAYAQTHFSDVSAGNSLRELLDRF